MGAGSQSNVGETIMRMIDVSKELNRVPKYVDNEIEATRKQGCEYLMVICDTFNDYEAFSFGPDKGQLPGCDYPIYCKDFDELLIEHSKYDGKNMQEVRGVYEVEP